MLRAPCWARAWLSTASSSSSWLAQLPHGSCGPQPPASALLQQAAHARLTTIAEPDDAYLYEEQLHTPNFVHAVSINQLDTLCRQPSLPLLVNSAAFLKSQLPARLENHLARLKALPAPGSPALQELLDTTVSSKARGLEVAHDWRLVDASDLPGLRHFESHLAGFWEHLEVEVARLTHNSQQLTQQRGWWDQQQQVRWLNRMLDLNHWYLLSARLMLTQHTAALAALEAGAGSSSGSSSGGSSSSSSSQAGSPGAAASEVSDGEVLHYHEAGHSSTDPSVPYTPPHQQLSEERPISLVRRHTPLLGLVQGVAEDCRAFCIEKNSAAPDVVVRGGRDLTATLVVPFVEFVLTEVLKNAMQAVIARFGAWDVDDAQPVTIELRELPGGSGGSGSSGSSQGAQVQIVVTDMGNGIPPRDAAQMYNYYFTSNRPATLFYGYSRNHGSQFQGQGVGVPIARVFTHFMGGRIEWQTDAWRRHTSVVITLPQRGFTF